MEGFECLLETFQGLRGMFLKLCIIDEVMAETAVRRTAGWTAPISECQGYGNPQRYIAGVRRGRGRGMIFETPGIPLPLWGV